MPVPTFKTYSREFLAVQWLGLCTFIARAQVEPLVRELRSLKPCRVAKKKKKKKSLFKRPTHIFT